MAYSEFKENGFYAVRGRGIEPITRKTSHELPFEEANNETVALKYLIMGCRKKKMDFMKTRKIFSRNEPVSLALYQKH